MAPESPRRLSRPRRPARRQARRDQARRDQARRERLRAILEVLHKLVTAAAALASLIRALM